MFIWTFLAKYRKHINFWQLLVIRALFPFALGGVFLGTMGLWDSMTLFFKHGMVDALLLLKIIVFIVGVLGVYYAMRVSGEVVRSADDE